MEHLCCHHVLQVEREESTVAENPAENMQPGGLLAEQDTIPEAAATCISV
jgi:hypothetical protein